MDRTPPEPEQSVNAEHEKERDPHITAADRPWLQRLSGQAVSDESLAEFNEIAALGAQHLTHGNDTLKDIIVDARWRFFEKLGWLEEDSPMRPAMDRAAQHEPSAVPLDGFFEQERAFLKYGVDSLTIYRVCPIEIVRSGRRSMHEHCRQLKDLGFRVGRFINSEARAVATPIPSLERRIYELRALGLRDPIRAIERDVYLAFIPREAIRATAVSAKGILGSSLNTYGVSFESLTNAAPDILRLTATELGGKISYLGTQGFDIGKMLKSYPLMLIFTQKTIKTKIEAMRQIGLDLVAMHNRYPKIMGTGVDTMRRHMRYLQLVAATAKWNGSVDKLVRDHPTILTNSNDRLRVLSALALDNFGEAERNLSEEQLYGMITVSADTHILAAVTGEYTYTAMGGIKRAAKKYSLDKREQVLDMLDDPDVRACLGGRALTAYLRYAPLTAEEVTSHRELENFL